MNGAADRYWAQFLASVPDAARLPDHYYDTFYFGTSRESCEVITPLVLSGVKTATGSLVWMYEAEHRRPPMVGDYSIVTDGDRSPVCIIESTEVRIVPYDEVDAAFAWHGGELDRTLESWRQIYWDYIVSECARLGRQPSLKTPLVCERFRVVCKDPLKNE